MIRQQKSTCKNKNKKNNDNYHEYNHEEFENRFFCIRNYFFKLDGTTGVYSFGSPFSSIIQKFLFIDVPQ